MLCYQVAKIRPRCIMWKTPNILLNISLTPIRQKPIWEQYYWPHKSSAAMQTIKKAVILNENINFEAKKAVHTQRWGCGRRVWGRLCTNKNALKPQYICTALTSMMALTSMTPSDDAQSVTRWWQFSFICLMLTPSCLQENAPRSALVAKYIVWSDLAKRAAATVTNQTSAACLGSNVTLKHADLPFGFTLTEQRPWAIMGEGQHRPCCCLGYWPNSRLLVQAHLWPWTVPFSCLLSPWQRSVLDRTSVKVTHQ